MNDRFKAAMPVVVSIAGSDCSGGAGIQADIKTCSALGVDCPTAVTAVTAQNPGGVKAAEYVGDRMMRLQLRAIFDSITPDAVKIGMLPCADAVRVIYDTAAEYDLKNIVIDPVLSATSGGSLSGETETTSDAAKKLLFPLAVLVTPNIPELFRLSGADTGSDISAASMSLISDCSVKNLLVKGGHIEGCICTDTLYRQGMTPATLSSPRIATTHTHGTGCTLSSAIACGLANGHDLISAIKNAKEFLERALRRGKEKPVFPSDGPLLHRQSD